MKNVLFGVVVVMLMLFFANGLSKLGATQTRSGTQSRHTNMNPDSIKYVKDSRTNICFAYTNGWAGAPANLAHAPCDSIPPSMLYVYP